jgi:DNA-binding transcriptional MerR regulator
MSADNKPLPAIPAKRYFTIGEVSELCGVKAYVLRYWEQEFSQLKPMKRRGNRRYYQHHEVLLIRRIRDLLYEQGFTISGARNQLTDIAPSLALAPAADEPFDPDEVDEDSAPLPVASRARDPGTRTRATDRSAIAELDDAALEAMAREDLAIIERAQRGVGEFATPPRPLAAPASGGPAATSGVRAAALQTRRSAPAASTAPAPARSEPATPEQLRAELLAIRALLVS